MQKFTHTCNGYQSESLHPPSQFPSEKPKHVKSVTEKENIRKSETTFTFYSGDLNILTTLTPGDNVLQSIPGWSQTGDPDLPSADYRGAVIIGMHHLA